MTSVLTALSTSLDGFIAGADDSPKQPLGVGGERLFAWLSDGDTPSQFNPMFKMSAVSAAFFDEGVARVGAAITGRRTYDVSEAWGGSGPMPAGKDVFLQGATIVQQCLRAGLMDELVISLVPVVLGRGVRLLDGLEPGSVGLDLVRVVDAPGVTHLHYRVVK
jgi:RibD C-terminal domain